MEEKTKDAKVIHIQVVGGSPADIYEIGQAFKKFKDILPYRLEAIITNDHITLRDVDNLIQELYKLKKQLDQEKRLNDGK